MSAQPQPEARPPASADFRGLLHGVWAAIPIPWGPDDRLDAGVLTEIIARYKEEGVHGVYTTGTDGEFHVVEYDDYCDLVDTFAEATDQVGIPAQVGATWLHTAGVLARARYARDRGVDAVQIALPFWEPMNDDEVLGFFETIATNLPDLAIIHYNIRKAGRFLSGEDYRRIRPAAPTLVGTKQTGGDVLAFERCVIDSPDIRHFVVDPHLVPGVLLGAAGTYSAAVNINPRWTMAWWSDCERGDWVAATRKKIMLDEMDRAAQRLLPHITAEPAWAKLYARCGIAPSISLAVRGPYHAASDADAQAFRGLLVSSFPELAFD